MRKTENTQYLAHIRGKPDNAEYQTLEEHCSQTAEYAGSALEAIGLSKTAELAALLHDAGKAKSSFQKYLFDSAVMGKAVARGSVNHSTAGCRYFLEQYHQEEVLGIRELTAEVLAYACGAHHGLFDCISKDYGFQHRLEDPKAEYSEAIRNYLSDCIPNENLEVRFQQAVSEMKPIAQKIMDMTENREDPDSETAFYTGMIGRLVLSALIDGDRRDTAEFMNHKDFDLPKSIADRKTMWRECLQYAESKILAMNISSDINQARRIISDQCAAYSKKPAKIIRLNIPTGSGKTLSSLRYALKHAEIFGKTRIIFTSSLLSVLDQNAEVIRNHIPNQRMILEHHSNVIHPEKDEERFEWEAMTESWSAPIIITTLVQLLNTLFLGKSGSIRRFYALSGAVLVIDEVQTVPSKMLTLFNLAISFLSEICDTTVVLCSATQPYLEATRHPLLSTPEDMVPHNDLLWASFQRTQIQDAGVYSLEEMPAFANRVLNQRNSLLIVCNMKKQAESLFQMCEGLADECYHLSASMCMQHRRDVLADIQKALNQNKRVLCISTQVIEAGIDISFQSVIRICAGLDNIVQAAGRCNRHGESGALAPVYIIRCSGEKLNRLVDIKQSQDASVALLDRYKKTPEVFGNDLTSDEAVRYYYRGLYRNMPENHQEYALPPESYTMYDLLSNNNFQSAENPQAEKYIMHQAFKTAGEEFTVFDSDTTDVIVPYGEGKEIRSQLVEEERAYTLDYQKIGELAQKAKPYIISLYSYQKERLEKCGGLIPMFGGRLYVLADGFYNEKTGFTTKETYWEV